MRKDHKKRAQELKAVPAAKKQIYIRIEELAYIRNNHPHLSPSPNSLAKTNPPVNQMNCNRIAQIPPSIGKLLVWKYRVSKTNKHQRRLLIVASIFVFARLH